MINRICISINNSCNLGCKYCHFHEKGIVDDADMRNWGKLPPSEFFPLDAATPRLSFTFDSTNPETPWHVFYGYTAWDEQPDDGKAFEAVRDLLSSCVAEENLIRAYTENVRN